jgi:hypothetical protein
LRRGATNRAICGHAALGQARASLKERPVHGLVFRKTEPLRPRPESARWPHHALGRSVGNGQAGSANGPAAVAGPR